MPISSLLVRTLPAQLASVSERLTQIPRVEVAPATPDQLVVLIDTETADQDTEVHSQVKDTPGVIGTTFVYRNFEDLEVEPCLRV